MTLNPNASTKYSASPSRFHAGDLGSRLTAFFIRRIMTKIERTGEGATCSLRALSTATAIQFPFVVTTVLRFAAFAISCASLVPLTSSTT